jgi:hypothetical protein
MTLHTLAPEDLWNTAGDFEFPVLMLASVYVSARSALAAFSIDNWAGLDNWMGIPWAVQDAVRAEPGSASAPLPDDGEDFESSKAFALEFGVLHSVLPVLPEPFFLAVRDGVTGKDQPGLAPMVHLDRERSPLLRRLKRAQEAGGADFWAAFS